MRLPTIEGVIDRRILVNFHIDPDVLARVLPEPFRPKLVRGLGMGGICLIRLCKLRPRGVPAVLGISSENAAHRFAVQWTRDGERREGVYIPRRDTNSRLNTLLGGRLFPGLHHHGRFVVQETAERFDVRFDSDDRRVHLDVAGRVTDRLPATSVFTSLREASDFFEAGSLGYSDTETAGEYEGLELHTINWHVVPLEVEAVHSSYFEDKSRFPAGSVEFDCALLMRQVQHQWQTQPSLCCATT